MSDDVIRIKTHRAETSGAQRALTTKLTCSEQLHADAAAVERGLGHCCEWGPA